ncbi:MAG: alpha/beta hydrolase [Pseudomonadota bacterium]
MTDDLWDDEEGEEPEPLADLFPGYESRTFSCEGARIFARVGGEGPPLVCLHGFPQTHVMWHRLAPALATRFTLVLMDLRGYGWSSAPRSDGDNHETYSKRAMARDVVEVMSDLGHSRFACLAHDRGARVAYRLGLDQPSRLESLVLLDILPTIAMWERIESDPTFAERASHWRSLARPAPEPEDAVLSDPQAFLERTLNRWSASGLGAFDPSALEHYRRPIAVPERVHAMCEDYRAGATLDREADLRDWEAGRKIACPVRVIWGEAGFPASATGPLEAWRPFADDLDGEAVPGGHFVAEEAPQATLDAIGRALGQSFGSL